MRDFYSSITGAFAIPGNQCTLKHLNHCHSGRSAGISYDTLYELADSAI